MASGAHRTILISCHILGSATQDQSKSVVCMSLLLSLSLVMLSQVRNEPRISQGRRCSGPLWKELRLRQCSCQSTADRSSTLPGMNVVPNLVECTSHPPADCLPSKVHSLLQPH